jgi:hypothetical protein
MFFSEWYFEFTGIVMLHKNKAKIMRIDLFSIFLFDANISIVWGIILEDKDNQCVMYH